MEGNSKRKRRIVELSNLTEISSFRNSCAKYHIVSVTHTFVERRERIRGKVVQGQKHFTVGESAS